MIDFLLQLKTKPFFLTVLTLFACVMIVATWQALVNKKRSPSFLSTFLFIAMLLSTIGVIVYMYIWTPAEKREVVESIELPTLRVPSGRPVVIKKKEDPSKKKLFRQLKTGNVDYSDISKRLKAIGNSSSQPSSTSLPTRRKAQ